MYSMLLHTYTYINKFINIYTYVQYALTDNYVHKYKYKYIYIYIYTYIYTWLYFIHG